MSRRAWCISAFAWLLLAFIQSPGLTSADTKHDLTADPWGFLHQALNPWTDVFPLGQLQNQAYGYLFPHGLFFALFDTVGMPGWITQRLWWALLLFLAFAGVVRVLEVWGAVPAARVASGTSTDGHSVDSRGAGSRGAGNRGAGNRGAGNRGAGECDAGGTSSTRPAETISAGFRTSTTARIIAGILYALSPRILTTLGAISSEAWVVALAPWVLLPIMQAAVSTQQPSSRGIAMRSALTSALFILLMGSVNAVATAVAVLPAFIFWTVWIMRSLRPARPANRATRAANRAANRATRQPALTFTATWIPAGILAIFWWVGPLLILGKHSPAFTDFIESSSLTTRWLSPLEVIRGTTSWTPFLSSERVAGAAYVLEPVFIVASLLVALIGLWGLRSMAKNNIPWTGRFLLILLIGAAVMIGAHSPTSPFSQGFRDILDGAGAALRNLHKFDPLVRLPLALGVAYALRHVEFPLFEGTFRRPSQRREVLLRLAHPEKNRSVVQGIALVLLMAIVTSPAWSMRLAAADAYTSVPTYWQQAADFLNEAASPDEVGVDALGVVPKTMILPEARFGRQTWGNTRDEPAQPLLDVPWVVRDSVPLVQPEAIRALDGLNEAVNSGQSIPTLAATLRDAGVGYLLVRKDLTTAADTPGAAQVLRTIKRSGGFRQVAEFGNEQQIQIFATGTDEQVKQAGLPRLAAADKIENVSAGPQALARLNEADAALGRAANESPRPRIMNGMDADGQPLVDGSGQTQTLTDTPALRDHNYGNVVAADSAIRASDDPTQLLNPVRDYPDRGAGWLAAGASDELSNNELSNDELSNDAHAHVSESHGRVLASSTGDSPTNFGGADTTSSITAAVDGQASTAWRPAPGVASGQWLEFQLEKSSPRLGLTIDGQGRGAKVQVSTYLGSKVVASTTAIVNPKEALDVSVPAAEADRIRITIVSAFGDFGISEATVTDTSGADVTPRRVVTLGDTSDISAVNRWVFGQEINEGVMTRQFTLNRDLPLVVHNNRCADSTAGSGTTDSTAANNTAPNNSTASGSATGSEPSHTTDGTSDSGTTGSTSDSGTTGPETTVSSPGKHLTADTARDAAGVTIDGKTYICGETLTLKAGTHTLSSPNTWVALTVAEPLYAAAVRDAPGASLIKGKNITGGEPGAMDVKLANSTQGEAHTDSQSARILWLPQEATTGREATLISANGTETNGAETNGAETKLEPLVINGWQQGWIVPAGATGTVHIEFAPTGTYKLWLKVGLGAGVLLVLVWMVVVWGTRGQWRRERALECAWMSGAGEGTGAGESAASNASESAGAAGSTGAGAGDDRKNPELTAGVIEASGEGTRSASEHGKFSLLGAGIFGMSGTVAVVGAAQGPWGSSWYAGDSWTVNIAVLVALAVPFASYALAKTRPLVRTKTRSLFKWRSPSK